MARGVAAAENTGRLGAITESRSPGRRLAGVTAFVPPTAIAASRHCKSRERGAGAGG